MKKPKEKQHIFARGMKYQVLGWDDTYYYTTNYFRIRREDVRYSETVKTRVFVVDFKNKKLIDTKDYR